MEQDEVKKYKYGCGYCGTIFTGIIRTVNKTTNSIKCPKCTNFVKVHEDIIL